MIRSVSFQERVQSTDLAALFPRGSLNQKRKMRKSSESSPSKSPSLENISSLQRDINITDKNISATFEGCSENKEECGKPFNKNLYLRKKSVNISLDSCSLSDPTAEKCPEKKVAEFAESSPKKSIVIQNSNNATNNCSNGNQIVISNASKIENDVIVNEENIESATGNDLTIDSLKTMNKSPVELGLSVKNARNKKVKSFCDNKNDLSKESDPISPEINFDSKHFPDVIPASDLSDRNTNNKSLRFLKRSRKETGNHTDKSEDSFMKNISNISDSKFLTPSRFMYQSTPVSRIFSKKNRRKIKLSCDIQVEDENDKMIQVSKSIFESSTEVTNATVSKKKSIEFSSSSRPNSEKNNDVRIKQLNKMESIGKSRSDFISSLEESNSYRTTKKSMKRVAFKSIASHENSSGYQNSSDGYAFKNRKSVGFRNGVSLIEDSVCENSVEDIRDANNSNLNTVITPCTANDSKSRIDRNDHSHNFSAEVSENEIESNEVSKECTLLNKLFEMAKNNKSGSNVAARQTKLSKNRKKSRNLNFIKSRAMPNSTHRVKWVSPNLIKFLKNKLMTDALDHIINTERIVSVLCSAVSAVRKLNNVSDIDFALLPLKNILLHFEVCCNMIEYYTFISRFTPFEFQRKALPLEGYFGSYKRGIKRKLTDPILTESEKMNVL